jgi:transcription initiation factor IIF auxiliary subunit
MGLTIKQESSYLGEDWWAWSIALDGPPEELDRVQYVVYTLHPTFPSPVRRVTDRSTHFRLDAKGWGTFTVYVEVSFKDGPPQTLSHELALYYPDGEATTR